MNISNKVKIWGTISLIVGICFYIFYLNYNILSLEKNILENKSTIEKLEKENSDLNNTLSKTQNEMELKISTIDSLKLKNEELADTKNSEINIWKRKYSYCVNNKNTTMKITKDEVMNNETSDFYINMYNNDIFN